MNSPPDAGARVARKTGEPGARRSLRPDAAHQRRSIGSRPGLRLAEDSLLQVADVAAWLDISTTSVYRLAERREIPFYRLRGALRFAKEDVERFLARQRVEAAEH